MDPAHLVIQKPVLYQVRSAPWFTVAVVMVAAFTDTLFYGIFVPFTPNILRDRARVSPDQLDMWNSVFVAIYGGAILLASPLFGYLSDHGPSRHLTFLLGFAALAAATVMMHLGGSVPILLMARVLQGSSAGCVYSAGFAMLHDTFGAAGIGQALGWISPALTAGAFLGPSLGGPLYDLGGEPAVFGCAYAVVFIDVCVRLAWKPPPSQRKNKPPMHLGCAEYGTFPVTPGGADGDDTSSSEPSTSFGSKIRRLGGLIVPTSGWLVVGVFLTAFDGVLPLFVQETFQWSVTAAGLVFLFLFLPGTIISPVCGAICDRGSPRIRRFLAAAGFSLCVPGFAILGLIRGGGLAEKILLCGLLAVVGSGTALSGPPLMKQVAVIVEDTEDKSPGIFGPRGGSALAYGLHNSAFALGNLLGPIIAGTTTTTFGWGVMGWVLAGISAFNALLMLFYFVIR